jgi:hypothetical protein
MTDARMMPTVSAGVEFVVVDGVAVLYDANRDELLRLNETASDVWANCDGTTPVATVSRSLAARYGSDTACVEIDVACWLEELTTRGLVQPARAGD